MEQGFLLKAEKCLAEVAELAPQEDYIRQHLQIVRSRIQQAKEVSCISSFDCMFPAAGFVWFGVSRTDKWEFWQTRASARQSFDFSTAGHLEKDKTTKLSSGHFFVDVDAEALIPVDWFLRGEHLKKKVSHCSWGYERSNFVCSRWQLKLTKEIPRSKRHEVCWHQSWTDLTLWDLDWKYWQKPWILQGSWGFLVKWKTGRSTCVISQGFHCKKIERQRSDGERIKCTVDGSRKHSKQIQLWLWKVVRLFACGAFSSQVATLIREHVFFTLFCGLMCSCSPCDRRGGENNSRCKKWLTVPVQTFCSPDHHARKAVNQFRSPKCWMFSVNQFLTPHVVRMCRNSGTLKTEKDMQGFSDKESRSRKFVRKLFLAGRVLFCWFLVWAADFNGAYCRSGIVLSVGVMLPMTPHTKCPNNRRDSEVSWKNRPFRPPNTKW